MKYADALSFLDSLVNYEKLARPRNEFKLDDIRNLLRLAGNPQHRLRRVVLVAGTKGKGSVCYMLEAALRACGTRTGMFVSPHVSTVRERIQLDGSAVSRQTFARQVERFVPLVKRQAVSYFELTAAFAFDLFARRKVEYAVLEVGLGGRLDATNLVEPDVSVITRIGFDHIRVLGNSLARIAKEKAGIMRSGRPVVVGRQVPAAARELVRRAGLTGAVHVPAGSRARTRDVGQTETRIGFLVHCDLGTGRVRLPLPGRHQVENCATALTVLGLLAQEDRRIQLPCVTRGLRQVAIPARCQVVERKPALVVDSCHNPDSGQALARMIAEHLKQKVVLVYGSLRGKLIARTVRPLAPWVERAVLVRPESPRAAELTRLRRVFGRLGIPYSDAESIGPAIERARQLSGGRKPIVVAGSSYLAGEALDYLKPGRVG